MTSRVLNMLIATWIFVAAFAYTIHSGLFVNMIIISLVLVASEVASMWNNSWHVLSMIVGVWLAVSAYLLGTANSFILWNNLIFGALVFVFSAFGRRVPLRRWDLPATARRDDRPIDRRGDEVEA